MKTGDDIPGIEDRVLIESFRLPGGRRTLRVTDPSSRICMEREVPPGKSVRSQSEGLVRDLRNAILEEGRLLEKRRGVRRTPPLLE